MSGGVAGSRTRHTAWVKCLVALLATDLRGRFSKANEAEELSRTYGAQRTRGALVKRRRKTHNTMPKGTNNPTPPTYGWNLWVPFTRPSLSHTHRHSSDTQ
eukprot:3170259-Amphidinium_carterae.1